MYTERFLSDAGTTIGEAALSSKGDRINLSLYSSSIQMSPGEARRLAKALEMVAERAEKAEKKP